MQNEAEAKVAVDMIIDFMQKDALPLLDKFNDLREIDKIINGDDFWITDWQMPFNLGGGNFYAKRLVIAKLAGGQKRLEEVIEKFKEAETKYWKEKGEVANLSYLEDTKTATGFTIQYLKNVPSLYE